MKIIDGKIDALVFGTVRPIAGSLLVAGALFCLGLMNVHARTVNLEKGETYGTPTELLKLDGVAVAARPVLRGITTAPFSFRFDTEPNRSYSIEGSVDLKAWKVLEQFKSTKRSCQFDNTRDNKFPHQYYRVRVE